MRRRLFAAALLLTLSACATQGTKGPALSNRAVLTSDEMVKAGYPDAFTSVQSLRPQWLVRHGQATLRSANENIKVYMDDSLLGGVETLRTIAIRSISSIRYMDGLQASERWGLDHGQGAIVVTTRK
jgi:hypothetical protein